MISLVYSKGIYEAKIDELQNYCDLLAPHITRMEELRNQMYTFWDDENARIAGQLLEIQLQYTRNAVDEIKGTILFYKNSINQLGTAGAAAKETLEMALSLFQMS